jgi:4-hydroxybenzoate polyprenyltransferase
MSIQRENSGATTAAAAVCRRLVARSRPRFWLYLAGPVAVGVAYGVPTAGALLSPLAIGLVGYFLFPANGYLYGINDVFDARIDRANPKKDDREIRYRGQDATPWVVVLTAALGLLLTLLAPPIARPYLLGFLALGAAYSAPPLRFKTRPPLDSLSNGLYVLPGAAAYAALAGGHPPVLVVIGAWLWTMAMHTFSAIPDVEADRRAGIRTTATVLDRSGALIYCGACWLLAATVVAVVDWRGGALLSAYPLLVVAWAASDLSIDRVYWWYPAINTVAGAILTLGGLWRLSGA